MERRQHAVSFLFYLPVFKSKLFLFFYIYNQLFYIMMIIFARLPTSVIIILLLLCVCRNQKFANYLKRGISDCSETTQLDEQQKGIKDESALS